jgi:polyisoprenoid-binding protein YceI
VAGEIAFEPGAAGGLAVAARLEVASIDTGVAARDEDLRSANFFDAATHPHIEFRSRAVEGTPREAGDRFRITGDLTIRGVTSDVVLDAVYEGMAVGEGGVELVGFTADGRIDRRVYGLNWNQALEAGGVLVGNDIRIRLEVQAAG